MINKNEILSKRKRKKKKEWNGLKSASIPCVLDETDMRLAEECATASLMDFCTAIRSSEWQWDSCLLARQKNYNLSPPLLHDGSAIQARSLNRVA